MVSTQSSEEKVSSKPDLGSIRYARTVAFYVADQNRAEKFDTEAPRSNPYPVRGGSGDSGVAPDGPRAEAGGAATTSLRCTGKRRPFLMVVGPFTALRSRLWWGGGIGLSTDYS